MSTKNKFPKQSRSKANSPEPCCYVIKYVAEGPERECFYQHQEDGQDVFSQLREATLFRSLESAQTTAQTLNRDHPFDLQAHAVLRVR